jgi:hypothetical protein
VRISTRSLRTWARQRPDVGVPADAIQQVLVRLLKVVDDVRTQVLALQEGLAQVDPADAEDPTEDAADLGPEPAALASPAAPSAPAANTFTIRPEDRFSWDIE